MDRTIVAEESAELILTTRQLSIRLHSWEDDFFDVAGKELPGGVSRSSNLENKIDVVSCRRLENLHCFSTVISIMCTDDRRSLS
jgi:hypothetical protein